jgi:hypothetical protein
MSAIVIVLIITKLIVSILHQKQNIDTLNLKSRPNHLLPTRNTPHCQKQNWIKLKEWKKKSQAKIPKSAQKENNRKYTNT